MCSGNTLCCGSVPRFLHLGLVCLHQQSLCVIAGSEFRPSKLQLSFGAAPAFSLTWGQHWLLPQLADGQIQSQETGCGCGGPRDWRLHWTSFCLIIQAGWAGCFFKFFREEKHSVFWLLHDLMENICLELRHHTTFSDYFMLSGSFYSVVCYLSRIHSMP